MNLNLKDKVVMITGSTGGVGEALTRAFAAEGCKLAISSTRQEKLDALVKSLGVAIGVITVPAETAQAVCSRLVLSGIKAIWNFAPVSLVVPPDVMVRSENMALSLALLSQHLAGKRN